ncbi:hypothetical protein [Mucilaginibacter aquariorum]|uniref:Lipocalin-like domain-containing protein n=1 Tax=Mucilaginibacter aquariorum TaxID=2967225 RepID=A0ABT1T4Y7_9SPHI|nr:hypothetical protein [Mucilaginibacter aquariorum]MCQ6959686.1 hypothetical protein [Mucilaginibacter aquariorum]
MNRNLLIIIFLWLLSSNAFSQTGHKSKLSGWWINTQYDYFQNKPQYNKLLYNISPWFIKIDSSDRCTVTLLYEQRADLGYPIDKKSQYGVWKYHYKKRHEVWLYSVEGNDSLMVYSNGITPAAGIIFKRYTPSMKDK